MLDGILINRSSVLGRFLDHARRMWGDRAIDGIKVELGDEPLQAGALAALVYRGKPIAIDNHLIRPADNRQYWLLVSPEILEQADEVIDMILIHEVGHIGHRGHSKTFYDLVVRFGGAKSGAHAKGEALQIQRKGPGERRYVTVREFPQGSEREAVAWAKAEMRLNPGYRYRMLG